ncbi:hypothetical protein IJG92_00685 [Candidatus Saccharibacteria bacterium]|nr:hypothetical protein [Candidatus Saccharibacteria bacterium]
MVMLQTSFSYKKDNDGFYHEVLANGNVSKKRFKKLENLSGWVAVKFRLKVCCFLAVLSLIAALVVFMFGRL